MNLRGVKRRPENIEICRKTGRERIYYRVGKGPRIRLPGPIGSAEFKQAYDLACQNIPTVLPAIPRPRSKAYAKQEAIRRLSVALTTCRSRAEKRGWVFDLDEEWLAAEIARQGYRCALTGIPFLSRFGEKTKVHPFTPSIDRINSRLGYTKANCRLVVFAINAMMMDWGEEVFAQVAKAYRLETIKRRRLDRTPL